VTLCATALLIRAETATNGKVKASLHFDEDHTTSLKTCWKTAPVVVQAPTTCAR
jgi:hypothetical protein